MTTVRVANCFLRAGAVFKEPILSWTAEVPSRFFRALYRSLNETLYIQPSDFVAPAGVSLGDCSAALRIFGGNSSLTLKASGIIAEFPALTPDRMQFADTVIYQGYEAFLAEFRELEISSIESNAGYQLEISDGTNVDDILRPNLHPVSAQELADGTGIVIEPALRCRLVGDDGKWTAKVTAEKSEYMANGIYVLREIIIGDLSECETTQQKFTLVENIERIIMSNILDITIEEIGGDVD